MMAANTSRTTTTVTVTATEREREREGKVQYYAYNFQIVVKPITGDVGADVCDVGFVSDGVGLSVGAVELSETALLVGRLSVTEGEQPGEVRDEVFIM